MATLSDRHSKNLGFRWENNVLIGAEVVPDHGYTSLGKFVLDALENDPEIVGQIDAITGEAQTFATMRDRSVRCALWMKKHGFRQNDVVTICSHNHLDVAITCFAASYLGIPFNGLDLALGIRWMHTGDIGYYDEDGEVFYVDRIKEVMKYRNFHVSPVEIESLLYEHPGVAEVAVSSVPHPTDVEHPVAFVVRSENSKVTAEELMDLVAAELSDYKQLRGGVKFVDHVPKTPSGKISRRAVRELAKSLAVQL